MESESVTDNRFTVHVLALTGALATAALGLGMTASSSKPGLLLHIPVWVAFLGLLVAGSSLLTLEVQANAFSISLTEIPIVLCLLGMSRGPFLIAGTAGAIVALLLSRRRAPLKLAFNSALVAFELAAAVAIYDHLVGVPDFTSWQTWAALLGGIGGTNIASGIAVNAVISMAGDAPSRRQAIVHSLLGLGNALVIAMMTLLAAMTVQLTWLAALPLASITAIAIVPLRRFARLQRRYDGLLLLHEFTAGLTGSTDLETTLTNVLTETTKVLRCTDATIALPRTTETFRRSHTDNTKEVPAPGDPVWTQIFDTGQPVRLSRGSTELNGYLARHALKDLMAAPLTHGEQVIGVLMVQNRLGEVSTFDADDLAIFATMANQTTVTMENLRLIDRLRDESAEREHQALHDELTGLPNRAHLYATLDQVLTQGPVAVAMVDLNRFKEVNDTLGHHAGDEVLIQTAQRLRSALPKSALVARLGGDEFAIVLTATTTITEALATLAPVELAFTEPMPLDTIAVRIDASIGVAVSTLHGKDRATLLRRADVAMYAAKQHRGTIVRAYDRSQERSSKRSLEIITDLRTAIEHETLTIAFQPKARLDTTHIVGVEALARWTHPTLGPIGPDEFIPLAEHAGLTEALTNVIMRGSLEAATIWREHGHDLTVAVNVDAQTLLAPGFTDTVLNALKHRNLPPETLTIEITERELVRELNAATTVISELRSHGIALSIDDFGTGYSSLAYLSRLPFDEVKIDKAFITGIAATPIHQAIVRAIADITTTIGATTVCEGIEDQTTWDTLATLNCTYAQGYHLARPMPLHKLLTWLSNHQTTQPNSEPLHISS
jgi:diguanylate cyclase (GGDEF)-like protein